MSKLRLDLYDLVEQGYHATEYDIGGAKHEIYIKEEDREAFLDAFAAEYRKIVAERLVEVPSKEDWEIEDE